MHGDLQLREPVRDSIADILDLERLLSRISLDSAGPRDLLALAQSAAKLPLVGYGTFTASVGGMETNAVVDWIV